MSQLKVSPSRLTGKLVIPASKSQTLRALLFATLAKGRSVIHNYLKSSDTQSMIDALTALGSQVEIGDHKLVVEGVDGQPKIPLDVISAGNSGIVLRFIGALAALIPSYTVITGDGSIRCNRLVAPLLSGLNQLGAFGSSMRLDNRAPIIIRGVLQPGNAHLYGADSQPISALLIATSFLKGTTHLTVNHAGEKPWIDLTLFWLRQLGGSIVNDSYTHYTIRGPIRYSGFETFISGDFSSAAFALIAALITQSTITLQNLDFNEPQGDKKIVDLLISMGARITIDHLNKNLTIYASDPLKGIKIDGNEMIDAIPILATLGCFTSGPIEIYNAAIARKKESDRLHAICLELGKMGGCIEEREDGLIIIPAELKGASLFSHGDHRIAMALAVAALGAKGASTIDGIECMNKTYPSFVADFKQIGAQFD